MTPPKVLVIDDHAETLELMRDVFAEVGYESDLASEVSPDLAEILESRPDLVIVDLRLSPESWRLNGWDLVRLMKSHRDLRQTRILVLSADAGALDHHLAEAVTMDGVQLLAKPFSLDNLLSMVRDALRDSDVASKQAENGNAKARPQPPVR